MEEDTVGKVDGVAGLYTNTYTCTHTRTRTPGSMEEDTVGKVGGVAGPYGFSTAAAAASAAATGSEGDALAGEGVGADVAERSTVPEVGCTVKELCVVVVVVVVVV